MTTTQQLREYLMIDESVAWSSENYTKIKLKLVNKEIVNAWRECMNREKPGIRSEILGNKEANFVLLLSYTPTRPTDSKTLEITSVTVQGANPKGALELTKGATLESYSGLSQMYSRDGKEEVAIVVNFRGASSVRETLAAIIPPAPPVARPVPPPAPQIVAIHVDIHTTRNDKDREVEFTYTVHEPGVGAVGEIKRNDGVWPDGEKRSYRIPLTKPFPVAARFKYALRVTYNSSDGDPNWIGRISARAEIQGQPQTMEVLGWTVDFEMGHLGGHPERKTRDFQFNK